MPSLINETLQSLLSTSLAAPSFSLACRHFQNFQFCFHLFILNDKKDKTEFEKYTAHEQKDIYYCTTSHLISHVHKIALILVTLSGKGFLKSNSPI